MTEQEDKKLSAIRAKCVELLEIASKRTPGEWVPVKGPRTPINCGDKHIAMVNYFKGGDRSRDVHDEEHAGNVAFIASCAGPAEAGWRSTIAAIDICFDYDLGALDIMAKEIITAWEGVET